MDAVPGSQRVVAELVGDQLAQPYPLVPGSQYFAHVCLGELGLRQLSTALGLNSCGLDVFASVHAQICGS